ncbi:Translin [Coprinopsis marcescibilis]|uniref:Translin n=1 Tax=Coprinopsis marcescibilis TaxID=230819 RepID=A0A5C3LB85_COPMA|nr:Translin [Coprinopsis marcescibilis]
MSVKPAFENFRRELDESNDRRERLIKASRDITNLSKKTIFLLHRLMLDEDSAAKQQQCTGSTSNGLDDRALALNASKQGYLRLREVQELYAGLRHELGKELFWRHERQVSPGLQEYIEALSFAHYLEHGTLISYGEVQKSLSDSDGVPYFPLTVSDYLLGLSDLTGELMRYAISGLARKGGRKRAVDVCVFVRNCKADFERYTPYIRELRKKQAVTSSSLEKIEDAVYAIFLRSSEYDIPPDMLDDIVAQSISSLSVHPDNRRDHRVQGSIRTLGFESRDMSGDEDGF